MMTGFVVGVPAAMMLRNVWALVLSLLAASTVDMLLSYWVHPYRPRPRLRISRARELMQFGRWISWFKAVGFVSSELPGLVVAKTVSPLALGQFQMARQLAVMPPVTLGIHAHGVLFPALVALTDDNERRRAFLRALAVLSAVAIPLAAALTVFGPRLINVGLGAKWRGTELPLQILAWAGCFRAMTLPVSALFMAMGRPRLDFLSGLLNAVVLIALLHPAGATFGVAGVTAIVTLGSGMTFLSQQALVIRQGGVKWLDLARAFSGGIFASLPIFVVVIVPDESAVVSALVATVAAIASGALLLKTLQTSLAGSVSSIKGLQA
jgi:O-antigen/teichoic acid export membrane protein